MRHQVHVLLVRNFSIHFGYLQLNLLLYEQLTGHTTPAASVHGSDSEEDSVDDELELQELGLNDNH